jgi:site-specific DNA-methyltransferase (adenine-specific)
LARILVNCFCPVGGIVLDPFAGSGTFCKAAKEKDRKFIAFENNQELIKDL